MVACSSVMATKPSTIWRWWLPGARVYQNGPPSGDGGYQELLVGCVSRAHALRRGDGENGPSSDIAGW